MESLHDIGLAIAEQFATDYDVDSVDVVRVDDARNLMDIGLTLDGEPARLTVFIQLN